MVSDLVLRLTLAQYEQIVGHCYEGLPDEACGLLGGPLRADNLTPAGDVTTVYPCANADASARTYTVDSRDHIRALRDAEAKDGDLVGVFHSHTHTEPYWIYVLVSLRREAPELRAYRITDGAITEVPVEIRR